MKKFIVVALMAMFCVTMQAQEVKTETTQQMTGEDYRIVSDEVIDGVR